MTEEPLAKSSYQKAMNNVVCLLARRDHTSFEIQQKLAQRGFGRRVIDRVLAECRRLDYLDDERTARMYIGQLARRGFGFHRMRLELKKKGLEGSRFENILTECNSEIDEREIARKVILKRMKSFERIEDRQKRRDKIYRFLHARGFTQSVISEIIREFC